MSTHDVVVSRSGRAAFLGISRELVVDCLLGQVYWTWSWYSSSDK